MGKQTKKDIAREENDTTIGHVKLSILPTIISRLSSNQVKILDTFVTPMVTRPTRHCFKLGTKFSLTLKSSILTKGEIFCERPIKFGQ